MRITLVIPSRKEFERGPAVPLRFVARAPSLTFLRKEHLGLARSQPNRAGILIIIVLHECNFMSSRLRTNGPLQQAVQLCKHSLYLELLPELAAATPLLVRARAHEPDIFLSLERRRNRCDRIKGDLLSYHAIDRSILRSTIALALHMRLRSLRANERTATTIGRGRDAAAATLRRLIMLTTTAMGNTVRP